MLESSSDTRARGNTHVSMLMRRMSSTDSIAGAAVTPPRLMNLASSTVMGAACATESTLRQGEAAASALIKRQ